LIEIVALFYKKGATLLKTLQKNEKKKLKGKECHTTKKRFKNCSRHGKNLFKV